MFGLLIDSHGCCWRIRYRKGRRVASPIWPDWERHRYLQTV